MASRAVNITSRTEHESNRLELLRSAPMNSWLALSSDETRIVATAGTFVEADAIAKRSGEKNYILTRTPDAWVSRAFAPLR